MSVTIQYEVRLLAASLAVGIALMMAYDGLRLFRMIIPHGNLWTGMEDAFYWFCCGIVTFLLLFHQNDGILRWYAIAGVLSGMLVYNASFSRILFGLLKKIKKYLTMKRRVRNEKKRKKANRKKDRKGERPDEGERTGKKKEKRKLYKPHGINGRNYGCAEPGHRRSSQGR